MKQLLPFVKQPKFLVSIIVLQTLALIAAGTYMLKQAEFYRNANRVLAESETSSDSDFESCLKLPTSERPICAKMIGAKLASSDISAQEKIKGCMKLRPIYHRYCFEELRVVQTETPTPTSELPQDLSPTVELSPTSVVTEVPATTAPTESLPSPTP